MSEQENKPEYTPASPTKRALAWIGIVYMVIIIALTTYFYFTGTMLGNLGPMLTIPGLIGAGILLVVRHRTEGVPPKVMAYGGAVMCWVMAAVSLPIAIVGLMSNFGG